PSFTTSLVVSSTRFAIGFTTCLNCSCAWSTLRLVSWLQAAIIPSTSVSPSARRRVRGSSDGNMAQAFLPRTIRSTPEQLELAAVLAQVAGTAGAAVALELH